MKHSVMQYTDRISHEFNDKLTLYENYGNARTQRVQVPPMNKCIGVDRDNARSSVKGFTSSGVHECKMNETGESAMARASRETSNCEREKELSCSLISGLSA